MSDLKTLKNFDTCSQYIEDNVDKNDLKREVIRHIQDVQTGGFDRTDFPEFLKGSIAKSCWEETMFQYGMEYGFIWALWMFFNLKEEDLK